MTSAFPPPEHNPHEWAVVGSRHEEFVNAEGNPVVHDVQPAAVPDQAEPEVELVGEHGPELVDPAKLQELADANVGGDSDQDGQDDGDEPEGGEQPSAAQSPEATEESAGTASKESSKPESSSTTSGAKPSRKPARSAGSQ